MHRKRTKCILGLMTKTAGSLMLLAVLSSMVACKPGQFLQRNACELLNCNVLFFIDDIFPLATQSSSGGGGGSGSAAAEPEEEEGGGHLH